MSDLSPSKLSLSKPFSSDDFAFQLSPKHYFDTGVFAQEQALLFAKNPRYVGHALSVPEPGRFFTLAHEHNGRALIRTKDEVVLLSNVCRHRQAVMLGGLDAERHHYGSLKQTGGNLVCPIHRWTYSDHGELLGAPHFSDAPCLNLKRYATQTWNGLVFENGVGPAHQVATDLTGLGCAADLDFSGYQFHSAKVHHCDYNWKTFIEVYLEDYHVEPFHPGLGGFVTCEDLRWEFHDRYSVQVVGMNRQFAQAAAGSPTYQAWHEAVRRYHGASLPKKGAVWLTLYPNVMVEWYPQALVVSTAHALSAQKTLNVVEFFYPEEICAFEPEYIAAQQAAYMETCVEDDEIALRMDAGRQALMRRGDIEVGPYQSPMEDGMQHFHRWYRREMART